MNVEVEHQIFADIDEHAEALHGWDQRYQQISQGNSRSALTQLMLDDDLTIFREEFSQRVTQQGIAPGGSTVTLGAIVNTTPSTSIGFQDQPLGMYDLLCVPSGNEFTLHLPPNSRIFGVTLKQSDLEILIPEQMHSTFKKMLSHKRINVNKSDYIILYKLINNIINFQINNNFDDISSRVDYSSLIERVPMLIASMITGGNINFNNNLTYMIYSDIVKRCRQIAMHPSEKPVTVEYLCKMLKISPRTLTNSFTTVVGTSPASYLRSVRLAEVRRLLTTKESSRVPISDAAELYGFSITHFSSTYQRQYGELPSAKNRKKYLKI